jgi:hypothetical protein
VAEVAGIELLPSDGDPLPQPLGAACATVELAEGPVKVIDAELLQRAIDNLVEA